MRIRGWRRWPPVMSSCSTLAASRDPSRWRSRCGGCGEGGAVCAGVDRATSRPRHHRLAAGPAARTHRAAGDELVGEYVDDGQSGARLDRPGLDALRDAAEAGLVERVWCLSPDRLARAYAYQVLVLDELDRFGVTVAFTDSPGLAADDPQATLLTQVQGVIAEYEKAKIAERYRRGKLFRARAGEVVTWKASYGYRRIPRSAATGQPTTRSTSPRPPWCGGSSPTAPPASPCARSAAGSTPTRYRRRPANPPGDTPRSAGCCATRPTSAGSTSTAPNRCPTGAPPTATGSGPARPGRMDPDRMPPDHLRRAVPGCQPSRHRQHQMEPAPRRTRPMAAQRPRQMRCLRCRHQLPQDARPQRHLAPLLLLPQPRPPARRRRTTPLPRTQHPRRRPRHLRVRPDPRRDHPPDQLLAGEQAVTLHTPIPDDELLAAELARLDRKIEATDTERRRLIDLYQGGFIELPEMQRRSTEVASRRKELQHKRTSLADERTALARDNQLRRRVHDFAARIHAVIDTLDDTQKQQLLRLLVEDVRVTGWHVQIRLRIALDPPPPEPPHPTGRTGKPPPHLRPVSTQDGLRSVGDHRRTVLPSTHPTRPA